MQKEVCRSPRVLAGVYLPDFAHHKLKQARDQLALLSQLAAPRGEENELDFRIAPEPLAELFERHAMYLDEVLDCVLEGPCCGPRVGDDAERRSHVAE